MAQLETVILVCDLCEKEDGVGETTVSQHTIAVDGRALRVIDACEGCWGPHQKMLEKLIDAGRSAKRDLNGRRRLATVS